MADLDLLYTPAVELAGRIRRKELSPVELVDAVLARIEATQPTINAFITDTAETARTEAKAAEQAVMADRPLGPLHGIPFSVKDLTPTAGVRTTMGSAIFADQVPAEDAVPVARARAAGAILVGKTTTPEFGHKALTDGPLFGRTVNPWDHSRTCGGSSGGAAAAVSLGMAPLAFGTDGGGSVRIPAACCGIVGLKATLGRIPNVHAPDSFANISYIGPMTRTVADNRLLYEVMGGPDPRDVHAIRPFAADQRLPEGRLEGVRIGWMAQVGNRIDPEVLAQAEAVVRVLDGMGAVVEPVEHDFASLEREFLIILQSGLCARLRRYLPEYRGRIDVSLRTTIERGSAWSAEDLQRAGMVRTELFRRMQKEFERYDFLLSPTLAAPALPVTQDAFAPVIVDGEPAGQLRGAWYPYTWPFNLTGHPALTIPSGWSTAKLPTAVQIVAPFYAEARLFDLATRLESARPWAHQRPPEPA